MSVGCNVQFLEESTIWSRVVRLAGSGTGALLATLLTFGFTSQQLERLLSIDIRTFTRGTTQFTCSHCSISHRPLSPSKFCLAGTIKSLRPLAHVSQITHYFLSYCIVIGEQKSSHRRRLSIIITI